MKGIVYIEKRKLPPSKNYKEGRTRYYVISEVDGEKRSHGGYNTERAAKDKRRELLKQIAEGTFGKAEKQDLVFKDYYEDWWTRKKTELGSGTIIAYQNSYEGYIGPFFNDMKLRDITPEVVQQFVDSINNLAPGYSRTIYGHFRSCINSAAYLEIMSKSPCTKGISLPPVPREIKKYFGPYIS
ncbi:MAG TPA: N-terminal phage integrase SAM-like domain-containing protein [Candidatus Anoxymicrobiaceae bacterium]